MKHTGDSDKLERSASFALERLVSILSSTLMSSALNRSSSGPRLHPVRGSTCSCFDGNSTLIACFTPETVVKQRGTKRPIDANRSCDSTAI